MWYLFRHQGSRPPEVACLDVKPPGQALGFFCRGTGSITLSSRCLGFCLQLGCLLGSIAGCFVPPVAHADFFLSCFFLSCFLSFFLSFFSFKQEDILCVGFAASHQTAAVALHAGFCCLLIKHQLHTQVKFSSITPPPVLRGLCQHAQQQCL